MDKNSLQEYGWIVIIVIILSILIAFAAPFGKFIVTSVQNTIGNVSQIGQNEIDNIKALKKPEGLNVKNEILTFDKVLYATGYTIKIGESQEFTSNSTTVDISEALEGIAGSVIIYVNAFNDKEVGPTAEYTYYIPGLYATGSNYTTLINTWEELVTYEVVHVEDGVVYTNLGADTPSTYGLVGPSGNASSPYLSGDLLLPHDGTITAIGAVVEDPDDKRCAFAMCEELTGIKIPSSVTSIGTAAFMQCSALASIYIPDSVRYIGEDAFLFCESLEEVRLSPNIETISERAFSICVSLKEIVIPEGVVNVGSQAFVTCVSATKISLPNSINSIGNEAFANCAEVTEVIIPQSVSVMGRNPFCGCTKLTNLIVDSNNGRFAIIGNGLVDKTEKTLITGLTNTTIPSDGSVKHIGAAAFYGNTEITSVVIPEGVESIGGEAFNDCANIESISIPASVQSISYSAISGCENLESIVIPNGVTILKSGLCQGNYGMKSITIPKTVTKIESFALRTCTTMEHIYYQGTVEEWNNVELEDFWDMQSEMYTIHCTNGDIARTN